MLLITSSRCDDVIVKIILSCFAYLKKVVNQTRGAERTQCACCARGRHGVTSDSDVTQRVDAQHHCRAPHRHRTRPCRPLPHGGGRMRRGCTFLALARVPPGRGFRLPAGSQGSKNPLFGVPPGTPNRVFWSPGSISMGFSRGRVGGGPGPGSRGTRKCGFWYPQNPKNLILGPQKPPFWGFWTPPGSKSTKKATF